MEKLVQLRNTARPNRRAQDRYRLRPAARSDSDLYDGPGCRHHPDFGRGREKDGRSPGQIAHGSYEPGAFRVFIL